MHHHTDQELSGRDDTFPTDVDGLAEATRPAELALADREALDLRLAPVAKRLGEATVRMLAYNGSIPGPTVRVVQGSEIGVRVTNNADLDTTVHWHGLRLENRFDGVPHETQTPIPVGGSFTYRLKFPDAGLYWYHPHIREDYGQELGLYGNIVVVPDEPDYWPPVHREVVLTLDDLLLEEGKIAPFSRSETNYAAMGRFGNVLLIGGEPEQSLTVHTGEWDDDTVEVNRLTTTANMRWKLVDRPSGAENAAIDWRFRVGDRVKIRLINEMDSDHPMHHPFHLHGSRPIPGAGPRRHHRAQPGLEGHGVGPHWTDRGHPLRRDRTRPVDGPLPHRRTHAKRHDVQLHRRQECVGRRRERGRRGRSPPRRPSSRPSLVDTDADICLCGRTNR
jgi:FtsP/CotA-like multicopper oxidase with cupredoxin domain